MRLDRQIHSRRDGCGALFFIIIGKVVVRDGKLLWNRDSHLGMVLAE